MCSFQTSTGTLLMFLVVEKMGAAAVDEDDELVLDFCRLAGGAVDELFEVDILREIRGEQISKWPQKVTGSPEMKITR